MNTAEFLNHQIYSAASDLPRNGLENLWTWFSNILREKYNAPENDLDAWYLHRHRLYLTVLELLQFLPSNGIVVEMGGESPITDLLRCYFPRFSWNNTRGDLRQVWDYPDNSADLIISMEVLEHLQDNPDLIRFQELFEGSGIDFVLKESYRVLKSGGCLFVTTPNGASVWHLYQLLMGRSSWFANIHVREYTPDELLPRIERCGFRVEYWKTVHCLTVHHQIDYRPIFDYLIQNGFSTDNRGDDIFLMARKT